MKKCINRFRMTGVVSSVIGKIPEACGEENLAIYTSRRRGLQLGIAIASGISRAITLTGCLAIAFSGNRVLGQTIPDATLGRESSSVTPNVNVRGLPAELIEGGAARGANLFHSFSEFNVGNGQRVYFANPAGIQNILNRVTGTNPSNILGTLGIDGTANLFLLNPNGIIFGPNAHLDIAGSFVATTANSLVFKNGFKFSATNPQAPPVLTINLRPGLQYGSSQSGTITNAGNLAVGQNLGLFAGNLDLQGQLHAGRNLTLQALDTVRVRDSAVKPFIASAGNQLVVQGNQGVDIFALNHAASGFASGGDMVLRSQSPVLGDAHYTTLGNFRIEHPDGSLGNLYSPHDPIIQASGDVSFTTYVGASLHILAGGSVNLGSVTITGADATGNTINPISTPTLANVTLSDGSSLVINGTARPTLDIRAGTTAVGAPGIIGSNYTTLLPLPSTTSPTTSANINIGSITVTAPNGVVFLTNQYQPNTSLPGGTIQVGRIDTSSAVGSGGDVVIDSRSGIFLTGNVNSQSTAASSNGGNVTLIATGDITTRNIYSLSSFLDGGQITLTSRDGAIDTSAGSLLSYADYPGRNGGRITLSAKGDITTDDIDSSGGDFGGGGDLTLSSNGRIFSVNSSIFSGTYGPGKAGDIIVQAGSLSLSDGALLDGSTYGQGNAGNVLIQADGSVSLVNSNIYSNVEAGSVGNGGNITIQAGSLSLTDIAQLQTLVRTSSNTLPAGRGNGGNINIDVRDTVTIAGASNQFSSGIYNTVEAEAVGNGGNIIVQAGSLSLSDGALIDGSTYGQGNAGNISISTGQLIVQDGAQIGTVTFSTGQGGKLTVNASESVELSGTDSGLFTDSYDAGDGGALRIETARLIVQDGAGVYTSARSSGQGGDLTVVASESVELTGSSRRGPSGLFSESLQSGNAGNITLTTPQLILRDGAIVSASVDFGSTGHGGNLTVTSNLVQLEGTSVNSGFPSALLTATAGFGDAGNLRIDTDRLIVRDGAVISTTTLKEGNSGNLTVNASESVEVVGTAGGTLSSTLASGTAGTGAGGDLTINTRMLTIRDGASVSAATYAQGASGNLTANVSELVEVVGTAPDGRPSSLFTGSGVEGVSSIPLLRLFQIDPSKATGRGGDLQINTGQLIVRDGAEVSASTLGQGKGGDVTVNASKSVELSNGGGVLTETKGSGDAGDLAITTVALRVRDGAKASASTSGAGNGGNLSAIASESVQLSSGGGLLTQTSSAGDAGYLAITTPQLTVEDEALATVSSTGTGKAGDLEVQARTVSLNNQGRLTAETKLSEGGNIVLRGLDSLQVRNSLISASTESGTAGDVSVEAAKSVQLSGVGGLRAEAMAGGTAGSLRIVTPQLTVENGAQATVSSTGTGEAGDLRVQARHLVVDNQARLSAQTEAGTGGNIILQDLKTLQVSNGEISASTRTGLAGSLSVNAADSVQLSGAGGLSVEALEGGTAGNLIVETRQMSVRDGAQVTVSSPSGQAGNMTITADSLLLNRGRVFAETGKTGTEGGANITLQGLDLLRMDNESLISANATGTANGGNITIDSTFIVATPPKGPEGSDIVANAVQGNGGRVSITTQGLFGIEFRPNRTQLNDITASSEFGIDGTVQINTPGVDPSRGLTELPTDVVDATQQIDRRCTPAGTAQQRSSFTITGRGGLPPSPNDPLQGEAVVTNWVSLDSDVENNTPPATTTPSSSAPKQLVEAQGWVINEKGQVVLTASAPNVTPQGEWLSPPECNPPRSAKPPQS